MCCFRIKPFHQQPYLPVNRYFFCLAFLFLSFNVYTWVAGVRVLCLSYPVRWHGHCIAYVLPSRTPFTMYRLYQVVSRCRSFVTSIQYLYFKKDEESAQTRGALDVDRYERTHTQRTYQCIQCPSVSIPYLLGCRRLLIGGDAEYPLAGLPTKHVLGVAPFHEGERSRREAALLIPRS